MLNTFNRYQAAEYNTATARARTAKQWTDFNADPIANELYPNLRWIRTRSANPRELHLRFAGLVLPKNDPFWLQNQPGNLWNCKCDWEETDDPTNTNDLTPDELDGYRSDGGGIHANGLDGNPAETGEIFSDQCTYIKKANNYKDIHAFSRDILQEKAKHTQIETTISINDRIASVLINKIGLKESSVKQFGDNDYWLKNELASNIDKYLHNAEYLYSEPVDLTHNKGKTLKLKKQMKTSHKLNLSIGNKDFLITLFEYKKTGLMLFYNIIRK